MSALIFWKNIRGNMMLFFWILKCREAMGLKLPVKFVPKMRLFSGYADIGWGWPSADVSMFGISFIWNAIGYSVEQGGLAYLLEYLIASFLGECVNFPLQRNFTFRSRWKLVP